MTDLVPTLDLVTVPLRGVWLIEASAGTGKTHAIANLYLRMLLECGRTVQQILVVTFTKAATTELRGRIRQRIQAAMRIIDAPAEPPGDELLQAIVTAPGDKAAARQALSDALICMDEAAIFTIHGVCQRLLQEYAFESGIPFEAEFISDPHPLRLAAMEDFWRERFYPASPGLARLALQTWEKPEKLLAELRSFLERDDIVLRPEIPDDAISPARYRELVGTVKRLWRDERASILDGLRSLAERRWLSRARGNYQADELAAAAAALGAHLDADSDDYFLPQGFALFTPAKFAGSLTAQGEKQGAAEPSPEFFQACGQINELCRQKLVGLRIDAIRYCRNAVDRSKKGGRLLSYDDLIRRLRNALAGERAEPLAESIARQFPVTLIDEFQDTDPGQYAIFSRIYRDRPECGLFMIGDPKQAIYSFRGGDVFTYMRARRATPSHYTLDTNWRSTTSYVRALNALFHQRKQPFVYADDIPYRPIHAAPDCKANAEPLQIAGFVPAPFRVWLVRRSSAGTGQKSISKEWARRAITAACADEIARLLDPRGDARIGSVALRARDIAILVRTHFEATLVQQQLQDRGLPSVYLGRTSIYGSEEAAELSRILAAVAEPENDRALRAALATEILGKTADWLSADDDPRWDEMFGQFSAYHEDWQRLSFIAMYRKLLHQQNVPERLMRYPDGERRLTNVLQLGELLQAASQQKSGMEALLQWFAEARLRPDDDNEDQQLRLESDAERVQIVTIHKSKGLEYPIVFLPFCWDSKPKDGKQPFGFHDESDPELPFIVDLAAQPDHLPAADKERLAEELRLLYVAATRARHRCYLAWGDINGSRESALAYLLRPVDDRAPTPEVLAAGSDEDSLRSLLALDDCAELFEIAELPEYPSRLPSSAPLPPAVLQARKFGGSVDAGWRITSFTALSADTPDAGIVRPTEPDHDTAATASALTVDDAVAEADSIFAFPKGARAGIFLHELFELLDFPTARGAELDGTVKRLLERHGYDSDAWSPTIAALVGQVLDTSLDAGLGLSLRQIPMHRRLNELQFHFPIAGLRAADIDGILHSPPAAASRPPGVDFEETRGMMQGFIDLVFEHGGLYFLLDYKSNHLGNRIEDYRRAGLEPAMREHRYGLQYLIYTVAVHRYLGSRVPGYRYRSHFGGVYYLFLRGMNAGKGPEFGVFFDKPEESLVLQLDALFGPNAADTRQ